MCKRERGCNGATWIMIGKSTKLFAFFGPDLAASRIYHAYNYVFAANNVDAALVNMSVPSGKAVFTLQNLGNSEIESVVLSEEAAEMPEILSFFDAKTPVVRMDIVDKKLIPVFSPSAPVFDDEYVLSSIRLNFFEWFGFFPTIPEDTAKTLYESSVRESVLSTDG